MLRRAVLTLVFGAGLPLGVLSSLALRSIASEQSEEARAVTRRAAEAADATADRLEGLLERIEANLVRQVRAAVERADASGDDDLTPRGAAVVNAVQALAGEALVREAFLAAGGTRLLWPRHEHLPPRETDPQERELVQSALDADPLRPDADLVAIDATLYQVLGSCRDPDLRAVVALRLAEVAERRGNLERARELLVQVRERRGARGLRGEPLAPDATDLFVQVAVLQGRRGEALDALLALARDLAEDRWHQDLDTRGSLLEGVAADVRLLAGEVGDAGKARAVLDELERTLSRAAFLEALETRVLPSLRRQVRAPSDGPVGVPVRLEVPSLEGTRLVVAAAVEGRLTTALVATAVRTRPGIVGVEVRLEAVRELLASDVAAIQSAYETRVAVLDGWGALYAGDGGIAPPGSESVTRPLERGLSGWRIVAVPRDPGAPARNARQRLAISGALVATCALAAIGAFAIALRAAAREVELAKLRTDLVRNVSHELRTPVASILMLSEVLEEGGLEPPKQGEYHGRIAREARRLSRLIENVLDLARVERGARRVEPQPLPLGETVAAAVQAFRDGEEGRDARIELEDASAGAVVPLDPVALEQILGNLISNAVKYSPEGEAVHVSCRAEAEARIVVRDRGRGLTPEEKERLFAPFYRARPEDGAAPGVGLGLVIARELIRLHGGRLEVESAPGQGSSFAVCLPREPA